VSEDTPRESLLVSCTFTQNVPPRTRERDEQNPTKGLPLILGEFDSPSV
jgi:hypothetical protein